MKKIHQHLKSEADFVARPFALRGHTHEDLYVPLAAGYPVVISSDVIFTGQVLGVSEAAPETIVAGETLSALRIVSADDDGKGYYTDPTNPDSVRRITGMTTSAASVGGAAVLHFEGKYQDAFWNWDVTKQLFLGATGTITQVAPTTGISVVLGHAQKPDTIFLNIEKPIILI